MLDGSLGLLTYLMGNKLYWQVSGGQVDDFTVGKASKCDFDIYIVDLILEGGTFL